ncbi:MAG: TonB-dependent receptor [Bacteroidota bacterium]
MTKVLAKTSSGATILDQTSGGGTTSNSYGHYSLRVKTNPVTILVSYVGYDRLTITLNIHSDTTIIIGLKSAGILEEVIVNASRVEEIQENSLMSRFVIPIEQIKSIPTLMGERDLMKVLQLLPGVQSGNEGSTGLYVRGGGPDQNLILLDGVPIYNASHLYGFFSTFNSDAINHVELVKGGFPARYGGRLSSVVDISMREGNKDKIKARATIGAISAKALIEGPINKKSTFLFSARRSYLNLLKIGAIADDAQKVSNKYYLFDLNGRLNYTLNKNNRIFLSGYTGGDKASSGSHYEAENNGLTTSDSRATNLGWGNTLAALRWNHVYGSKLFSNVAITYSKYRFSTATKITDIKDNGTLVDKTFYNYDYVSGIKDLAARLDFDYTPGNRQYIRFGSGVTHHTFSPGVLAITSKDSVQTGQYSANKLGANEGFVYIEDDIEITSKLKVIRGRSRNGILRRGKNVSFGSTKSFGPLSFK